MKEFEDVLLEISWNNLSTESKRYNDIDTKAISIITICGILTTLLLNFGSPDCIIPKMFFSITVLSFLITVILSIVVIKPRTVKSLSTKILMDFYKNKSKEAQMTGIIATTAEAEDILADANDSKSRELVKSVKALGISVILAIVYSLSLLV